MKARVLVSRVCVEYRITDDFNVGVGMYRGSALNPYLFFVVMNEVTKEIQGEVPWYMMFADEIVLVG